MTSAHNKKLVQDTFDGFAMGKDRPSWLTGLTTS